MQTLTNLDATVHTLAQLRCDQPRTQARQLHKIAAILPLCSKRYNQRTIARITDLPKTTVQRCMDWMENHGYITRHSRAHGLGIELLPQLTAKGVRAVNAYKKNGPRTKPWTQRLTDWTKAKATQAAIAAADAIAEQKIRATREILSKSKSPINSRPIPSTGTPVPGEQNQRKTISATGALCMASLKLTLTNAAKTALQKKNHLRKCNRCGHTDTAQAFKNAGLAATGLPRYCCPNCKHWDSRAT